MLDAVPWHRATGAEAISAALAAGIELDGVFALNDALAFGVLHGLHDAGLQVPGDVAVIGFDDVDDASYSFPTLSTVDPGIEWIARAAVDVLVERIAKGEAAGPYRRIGSGFEVDGASHALSSDIDAGCRTAEVLDVPVDRGDDVARPRLGRRDADLFGPPGDGECPGLLGDVTNEGGERGEIGHASIQYAASGRTQRAGTVVVYASNDLRSL